VISRTQRPLPHNTQHTKQTGIYALEGFGSAFRASDLPQIHVLDHAATGVCSRLRSFIDECRQILRGKNYVRIRKVHREYPAHYANSALKNARYQWHEWIGADQKTGKLEIMSVFYKKQKERQYTYTVTLRYLSVIIWLFCGKALSLYHIFRVCFLILAIAIGMQILSTWPLRIYHIFPQ
jgi:hypothetical protein